jgi:hemoglobin-like flavoprotein
VTPQQVKLVQDSFAKVAPIADTAADLFYDRLFSIAPQVRPLFSNDLAQQKRKLIQMLATAVTNLHQVEKIMPAVEDLGRRHVGYGVTSNYYGPVGNALLWALEQGLGSALTPAVKDAWIATYNTIADAMKRAAAEVPAKVAVTGLRR